VNLRRKHYYSEEDKGIAIQLKEILAKAKAVLISNPDTDSVNDTAIYYWNIIRVMLEKLRLSGRIDKYTNDQTGFWVFISDKPIRVDYNPEVIKYLFMKSKNRNMSDFEIMQEIKHHE
jgi:hypothetical protein